MAIRKCQLVKTENGTRTTMYLETGSEVVKRPGGQTVEAALASLDANKSPTSHIHTYKTTDIKRPNGVTTEAALTNLENGKAPMVHTHNDTVASGDSYKFERIHLGAPVWWGNEIWVILHIDGRILTLGGSFAVAYTKYNDKNYAPKGYASSKVRARLGTYETTLPRDSLDMAIDTTKEGVTAKIFTMTVADININVHPWFYDRSHYSLYTGTPNHPVHHAGYPDCAWWLAGAFRDTTYPAHVGPIGSGGVNVPGVIYSATTEDITANCRPFVRIRV